MSNQKDPKYNKFLVAVAGAVIAGGALFGVDVSGTVQAILTLALIAVPIGVYIANNGAIDPPYLNKAWAALAPAVLGVCSLFQVDASPQLTAIGQFIATASPLLVLVTSNQLSFKKQLLG